MRIKGSDLRKIIKEEISRSLIREDSADSVMSASPSMPGLEGMDLAKELSGDTITKTMVLSGGDGIEEFDLERQARDRGVPTTQINGKIAIERKVNIDAVVDQSGNLKLTRIIGFDSGLKSYRPGGTLTLHSLLPARPSQTEVSPGSYRVGATLTLVQRSPEAIETKIEFPMVID
jgi:hypothetical protein